MPEKNHLFTKDDYQREQFRKNKKLDITEYSVAGPNALGPNIVNIGLKSNLEPIQENFPSLFDATKDFGTVSLITVNLDFDDLGAKYNKFDVAGDITFAFNNMPLEKSIQFVFDIELTAAAPVITYPATVFNVPTGLPSGIGDRYILEFAGYKTSSEERYYVVGGFGSGGGATVPPGTIVNEHLEWNGSGWVAQTFMEFNATGPFADSGFLRFPNDQIMLSQRNVADDANLELKVTSGDLFDFTDSSATGSVVTLQLRAQNPEKTGQLIQRGTATGHMELATGTKFDIIIGGDTQMSIAPLADTGIEMFDFLDMSSNQIQDVTSIVYTGFATDGKAITRFASGGTGIQYDLENATASHKFRVQGDPPATVMEIFNASVDVVGGNLLRVFDSTDAESISISAALTFKTISVTDELRLAVGATTIATINSTQLLIAQLKAIQFDSTGGVGSILKTASSPFTFNSPDNFIFDTLTAMQPAISTDSANDAANDLVLQMLFQAESNVASTTREYGNIKVRIEDPSNTAEDGSIRIALIDDGTEDVGYYQANALTGTNIFFKPVDINDFMTFTERVGDPAVGANAGVLYAKDVSANTHIFWDNNTEAPVDLTAGGSGLPHLDGNGATTIIENTADTTKDWRMDLSPVTTGGIKTFTWVGGATQTTTFQSTGGLVAQLDAPSPQVFTVNVSLHGAVTDLGDTSADRITGSAHFNMDIIPDQAIGGNLGFTTAGEEFNNIFVRTVRFQSSIGISATLYSMHKITSPITALNTNVPSGAEHSWSVNGFEELQLSNTTLKLEGVDLDIDNHLVNGIGSTMTWSDLQTISTTGTTMIFNQPTSTDSYSFRLNSQNRLQVNDLSIITSNETGDTVPMELIVRFANPTTTGQPAIGNIGVQAEDSVNVQSAYAGMVTAIENDLSTSRDGRMQLVVAQNNSAASRGLGQLSGIGFDIQGGAALKIAFFGATPVVKQNPSVDATAIHAALVNYGLFV